MKPILFNTEMARAILENRKTVTRRVVRPQPRMVYYDGKLKDSGEDLCSGEPLEVLIAENQNGALEQIVPPYQRGSVMYVRETWCKTDCFGLQNGYVYKANDNSILEQTGFVPKWRPSIHMPREAARLFLRVMDVRVERLQDITEEGSIKEGFEPVLCNHPGGYPCTDCMNTGYLEPAMLGFVETWNSTIKKADRARYGWDANPWCWVIEFERISREEALKCG